MQRSTPSPQELKSSVTAICVAAGFARAVLTGFDHLFHVKEAHLTNHLCNVGRQSLRGFNWALSEGLSMLPYSWQSSFFSKAAVPSYDHVVMMRKLMIKQKIERAIHEGVQQIIFLGGGYDVRGLMTAVAHKNVHVFELDRGPTRESKMKGLDTLPASFGFEFVDVFNMHYIDCDLGKDNLQKVLASNGYSEDAPTLVIVEGVTMYLTEEANRQLLINLQKLLNKNSEVLLSYGSGAYYTALQKSVQSSSNELYQFSLPVDQVIKFVREFGFDVSAKFCAMDALHLINDENADYYVKRPQLARETYFSLTKNQATNYETIDQVPNIDVILPVKYTLDAVQ